MTIAGSITQSSSSVTGAVHVDGSNCFDQATRVGLTGTLTGSNLSLTSTSVNGQVLGCWAAPRLGDITRYSEAPATVNLVEDV
jgi:hypothetical protein